MRAEGFSCSLCVLYGGLWITKLLFFFNKTGLRIRFHFIRIRIRHFRLNTDPEPDTDPDPIRIQGFNDKKLYKKITAEKNNFFGSKTSIYLSLGLHKERPIYRRSLQISKEAIQHLKYELFNYFSTFVGHFCPPGSGYGFRIRIH